MRRCTKRGEEAAGNVRKRGGERGGLFEGGADQSVRKVCWD